MISLFYAFLSKVDSLVVAGEKGVAGQAMENMSGRSELTFCSRSARGAKTGGLVFARRYTGTYG